MGGGATVAPQPTDMQRETVLPEDKREGPSSKRANYATQNTIVKPNLKYEGVLPAPKDHMMVEFGSLLRVIKEGSGPKPANGAKGYEIGAVRQGPGPLCCFDDQVIAFDEAKGTMDFEVTAVRFPLNMFCAGCEHGPGCSNPTVCSATARHCARTRCL